MVAAGKDRPAATAQGVCAGPHGATGGDGGGVRVSEGLRYGGFLCRMLRGDVCHSVQGRKDCDTGLSALYQLSAHATAAPLAEGAEKHARVCGF